MLGCLIHLCTLGLFFVPSHRSLVGIGPTATTEACFHMLAEKLNVNIVAVWSGFNVASMETNQSMFRNYVCLNSGIVVDIHRQKTVWKLQVIYGQST